MGSGFSYVIGERKFVWRICEKRQRDKETGAVRKKRYDGANNLLDDANVGK
ncbi:hypothetical protein DFO70_10239 [Cytobacillus firmus]|uniref:Uncharacterized protein n=2 Tax=Cytobacillus TaxID=2675230 RepID=A0A366K205_CYTFI|nr:hypothetical protein DFO70_10239 [Cytobacillus firmus]TDX44627.1 hypothetical protein DFO72_10339 [Cytobacillus oceanisediminis]